MKNILTTPRFIVRQYTETDFNDFVTLLTDPEVKVYLPQHPHEKWRAIFTDNLACCENNPVFGRWGVADKITGRLIGNCMLLPGREGLQGHEVGYAMEKQYWGTGAGTEIVDGLVKYATEGLKLNLLYAITSPENIASRRVLEKAAFDDKGLIDFMGMALSFYQLKK